ncbi:unnamed protein product [Chilo suppressalis]|uniref:Amine oxidase domain-containing protein n=1 Tax=Chilo suppressalis TaxID=168631 RepID=A0ABN8BBE3_CHISP|nr:unnamed protein product [Chilo suppressalis]
MVKKIHKSFEVGSDSNNIQADVIILGCSLPGIVTAHKLKKKFGNTMDIVVLDIAGTPKMISKCNVSFLTDEEEEETMESTEEEEEDNTEIHANDSMARHFLTKYAKELNIPLPECILGPYSKPNLNKLFQHRNGNTVECSADFHDFGYLNFTEKLELNQFQARLDHSMKNMFRYFEGDKESERKKLLYYDQTTMEQYICDSLLFSTSREIMRTTVRLVCGVPADSVSILFYLHQCYRTSSSRNHLDGDNTRLREKLLGYCRKRLVSQLEQSIEEITLPIKSIKEIRTYSDEQVILLTMMGETNYICNLLAMALRPDELRKIKVEDQLLSKKHAAISGAMSRGRAKKFVIEYDNNFWAAQGYSGDIFSVRGPIIWAMEKPNLSTTGSLGRYVSLIGYLKVKDNNRNASNNKSAVIEQLVKLFGPEAEKTISYKETEIADVFVPRCGDYVALRKFTGEVNTKLLEWSALDIFADGDVVSALQAGHAAYLHLLTYLRPQAQTFEDLSTANWPTVLNTDAAEDLLSYMNYKQSIRIVVYAAVIFIGFRLIRGYMQK